MKKRNYFMGAIALSTILLFTGCTKNKDGAQNNQSPTNQNQANEEVNSDLLAEIKDRGVLKIGTEGTYAPYTYHNEENELVGFDIEIGRAIAEKLGVEVEFVETNWDACIAGLDAKRYDVVMNQVGITEERKEKYDFSTPYTVTRAALIVSNSNEDITSFDQIKGKKAAQSLTSNFSKIAEEYGAEIVSTDGLFSKAIELVLTKRADFTINDEITYLDFKKQQPNAAVKIVDTLDEASENAVLIRKGNDSFVAAVNEALDSLSKDGTLQKISEKYFGADVTK